MPPRELTTATALPETTPLVFTVDGGECWVAECSTRGLIDAYATGNPLAVVPGLCGVDTAAWLWSRLSDPGDEFDLPDMEDTALTVGAALAGIGYWPAARLLHVARAAWVLFDGWCVQHGLSPLEQPLHRVVAAVYAWRLSQCEKEQEVTRLDQEVFAPVDTSVLTGRHRNVGWSWSDEAESDAWSAAFAQLGGDRGG